MRIITGEYKGRRLESPVGYDIRPTSDKVKESIFNLLMHDLWQSVCVDLFAGTGNLGLEALSRGAKKCYFCDNSRDSIKLIKMNIEKCKAEEKSKVIIGNYMKCLERMKEQADIFFVDPPYRDGLYEKCLGAIDELDLLSDKGIIVAEHDKTVKLPERIGGLEKYKERNYGKIFVSLYRKYTEESAEECDE